MLLRQLGYGIVAFEVRLQHLITPEKPLLWVLASRRPSLWKLAPLKSEQLRRPAPGTKGRICEGVRAKCCRPYIALCARFAGVENRSVSSL
jgi:hypothetical protein